jgi:ubiquinone/menaquinone biosynthesis C-methylase UbiE
MNPDELKAKAQAQFGVSADDYATSDVHARGESLGVLLELVVPQAQWNMLDVATGAGHTALAFAPHVSQVTASDLTGEMLVKVEQLAAEQKISNIDTVLADAEALPLPDAAFDLVTCRLAFHHFPNPEHAAREFVRVLRPGGKLGFTDNYTVDDPSAAVYYNAYERLRDPSHHHIPPLAERLALLESAGFTIDSTRQLTKEFEFHAWADRQRVSDADKQQLLDMMRNLPPALTPLFAPRWTDDTMYFSLWEVVVVAIRS